MAVITIGITGSRLGATPLQLQTLMGLLLPYYHTELVDLHHGACVGVDQQAALLGKALKFHVVAHPPENKRYLSQYSLDVSRTIMPELPYLDRDRVIVDRSSLIVAIPHTSTEVPRSGTWYTYNYAKSQNKATKLILPDGTIQ